MYEYLISIVLFWVWCFFKFGNLGWYLEIFAGELEKVFKVGYLFLLFW